MDKPTKNLIDCAIDLLLRLGHDLDWYDLEKMSREQIAELIAKLKRELEG